MTVTALGDSAVVLAFAGPVDAALLGRVRALAGDLGRAPLPGQIEVQPAFGAVTVTYDPAQRGDATTWWQQAHERLAQAARGADPLPARRVELPVCYDPEFGSDLAEVASRHGCTVEEVVRRHTAPEYLVQAMGFVPGFPYLAGLPADLATPRRSAPRPHVPAGSVGIGGSQTGVYPLATPGGWNLLGRTPRRLFDPFRTPSAWLQMGDHVRFHAVSRAEFAALEEPVREGPPIAAGAAAFEVVRPGLFTTVQDAGRPGHRAAGVPGGGAADAHSLRLANLLVGNPEDAAALELTLVGPELRVTADVVVALAGADFPGLPRWKPVRLAAGTRIELGAARRGCRGYLAVAGGIEVPRVLGSRSTYVRAGMGGFSGRALRTGDRVPLAPVERAFRGSWRIDERVLPVDTNEQVLRYVPGAQAAEFSLGAADEFRVRTQSDRMGVRLEGPALRRAGGEELPSGPVLPGTLQVPPDGQPILLLADAQTLGGYPQLGHVITADLPRAGQLRPGDRVRFQPVSLEEAHAARARREHAVAVLRGGLAQTLISP